MLTARQRAGKSEDHMGVSDYSWNDELANRVCISSSIEAHS